MANEQIIDQGLTFLQATFGKKLEKARRATYVQLLADLPDDVFRAAVKHCAASCTFFPAPAEIRAAAGYLGKLAYDVPPADVAWGELVNMAHAPRTMRSYCDAYLRLQALAEKDPENYWKYINGMKDHDDCPDCQTLKIEYRFSHPLILEVATRLGWPERFYSDNIGVDRGRFIKTYENELDRRTQQSVLLPAVREFVDNQRALEDDRRAAFETGEQKHISAQINALVRSMS